MEDLPDYVLGQDILAWPLQGPIMDRSREWLGESDKGIIMLRRMCLDEVDKVERGEDPINTFRDPHQRIDLPIPDYYNPKSFKKGSLVAVTTGSHCPWLDEVDEMMDKAARAAREADAEMAAVG
jgi:5,5'-dehydrodivanillate O-demethylase